MATEDCPFKVVRTNGSDEVLARAINLLIGRAAFETAKRLYPRDLLEYRHGAQVIDRSGGRRSVAEVIRDAIRKVVVKLRAAGPVAIWDGKPKRTSIEHDSVHDQP
jgi:hypothetical protein